MNIYLGKLGERALLRHYASPVGHFIIHSYWCVLYSCSHERHQVESPEGESVSYESKDGVGPHMNELHFSVYVDVNLRLIRRHKFSPRHDDTTLRGRASTSVIVEGGRERKKGEG